MYEETQADLALIFANQAAIAIENARLYRDVKNSADRQTVLYKASQEIILAGLDMEQVYVSIHNAVSQLMPADSFVISILDEAENEIEAAYLYDKGKRAEPRRLPVGKGLSGHVIDTGEPLLAFDYYKQEELKDVDVVHFGSKAHIRSLLAVPLRTGKKVMGMLSAQTYKAYDYTPQDQQLLEMLAAYAAIAINNARLFSEVQRLAITDSLTGAYNRRHFFYAVEKELTRSRRFQHPIAVMMIDLDYFKEINDKYGHDVGDQALLLITQRCQENIREIDILARYGGDEFIILLPETTPEQAIEIAERLRKNLQDNPFQIDAGIIFTSLSIGVSGSDDELPELKDLLKCADIALYEAKKAGRNCVRLHACPTS
jgi:diguanylate cyclase (GGDEF)-like protein